MTERELRCTIDGTLLVTIASRANGGVDIKIPPEKGSGVTMPRTHPTDPSRICVFFVCRVCGNEELGFIIDKP